MQPNGRENRPRTTEPGVEHMHSIENTANLFSHPKGLVLPAADFLRYINRRLYDHNNPRPRS
jgi:hypothetical protein